MGGSSLSQPSARSPHGGWSQTGCSGGGRDEAAPQNRRMPGGLARARPDCWMARLIHGPGAESDDMRNSEGAQPYFRRNTVAKYWLDEKPQSWATSRIVGAVGDDSSFTE